MSSRWEFWVSSSGQGGGRVGTDAGGPVEGRAGGCALEEGRDVGERSEAVSYLARISSPARAVWMGTYL